jgi:hypothetical protein
MFLYDGVRSFGVCICSAFLRDVSLLEAASLVLSLVFLKPFPTLEHTSKQFATFRYDVNVNRYA